MSINSIEISKSEAGKGLEVGKKYLVATPEFEGEGVYVEDNRKDLIFAIPQRNLSRKIEEMYLSKLGMTIEETSGEIQKILGIQCYRDFISFPKYGEKKDRERFLYDMKSTGGLIICQQN